ncbi:MULTISPECIES: ATPase, T2SS/T4P/T4SS family [unclassified Hydrogenophaga]|uniref:ATPase, T2SS/T4P/T4SS family n=1 Tax=unclassified Hydrogenophaga TaxID=2610897 RepID=UPI001320557E|nr:MULTISPECIES: ATPase, T2SS/T4P/T4SS family [unclassified Hydrogenophaga]MDP3350460.1 ATPase, T2SS/T4P/T4SS family [Hydrogenophaga sp.]QHE78602.1 secretion system protein E [Hydrogenophaga sp. PBL-H3]QHE83027.1 secretion system protein E [Hydrogenophaga sp. PBL-H3]
MLQSLKFKDIYLGRSRALLSGVPNTKDPVSAPVGTEQDLAELRRECEAIEAVTSREEFPVRCGNVAYRASVMQTLEERVYVLRRMPESILKPEDLSIHPGYVEKLTRPGLSGLVVVAGPFGQGKTTTASSIVAARLCKFGGVGVTIEDPPEMPLEGNHGEGVCYQTWAERGEFGEACRKAARWAPSILLIGEIREPEAAAEALRASINGRLVFCTIHADSVPMAIERIYSLAVGAIGNPEDAAGLLANGLLAVMHQRLEGEPRKPKLEFLWLGEQDCVGVRNTIRQRKFDQVGNEVKAQLNRTLVHLPASAKV